VLIPFSFCRLPTGTTRLEFVVSGRSVAMSDADVGHSPACAAVGAFNVARKHRIASAQVCGLRFASVAKQIPADFSRGDELGIAAAP
jgi:hypothetical protein